MVLSLNGHLCLNIGRCPVPTPRTPNKTNGCLYQHISINMVSPLNMSHRYPVTYHTNTYTVVRNTAPHLLQALHCNISHANYSKCVMVSHFMNGVGRILQPGIMNSVWLAETLTHFAWLVSSSYWILLSPSYMTQIRNIVCVMNWASTGITYCHHLETTALVM